MNRWFFTRPEYREPTIDAWVCDITNSPPHHWPMHLITYDHMNGVPMMECTVFNTFAEADAVHA